MFIRALLAVIAGCAALVSPLVVTLDLLASAFAGSSGPTTNQGLASLVGSLFVIIGVAILGHLGMLGDRRCQTWQDRPGWCEALPARVIPAPHATRRGLSPCCRIVRRMNGGRHAVAGASKAVEGESLGEPDRLMGG